jgi:hypothetical protein
VCYDVDRPLSFAQASSTCEFPFVAATAENEETAPQVCNFCRSIECEEDGGIEANCTNIFPGASLRTCDPEVHKIIFQVLDTSR